MLTEIVSGAVLDQPLEVAGNCWGFGGVHGGLALAMLLKVLAEQHHGLPLRQVTAQFKRPLREAFSLQLAGLSQSRSLLWCSGEIHCAEQVAMQAHALFGVAGQGSAQPLAPSMLVVKPPEDCSVFAIPPAFVPFGQHVEIRPVNESRPFMGCAEAELVAWIRLLEDDLPPDLLRLTILLDALAPSYAALLKVPSAIPTVTFSITPSQGLGQSSSPWVLLKARTELNSDGWLLENIEAWSLEGQHLASAQQLRLLVSRQ